MIFMSKKILQPYDPGLAAVHGRGPQIPKRLTRDDLFALTEEAAKIFRIPYGMDADAAEVEKILGYRRP